MKWLVVLGIAGLAIDRLAVWAERKGWIYWRHSKARSGSASAAAFGPVFDVLQPGRQVITNELHRQQVWREDATSEDGDPGADCPDVQPDTQS